MKLTKFIILNLVLIFFLSYGVRMVKAATLTTSRDATSITTDDGTRKLVTDNADVAFGKKFFHTSINGGLTNLVASDSGCGSQGYQVVGYWDCQSSGNLWLMESTPTYVKIVNNAPGDNLSWITYPDGKSYIYADGGGYINLGGENGAGAGAAEQLNQFDSTNYTFFKSDTTNNNYAGMTVIPYSLSDFGTTYDWAYSNYGQGNMWWKFNSIPGTVLVDLSNYRTVSTDVTRDRNDYRYPDNVTVNSGNGWFDSTEYTASPNDYFNEHDGTYDFDADNNRLKMVINGGTYVRTDPIFKIRNWRSQNDPATITVGGNAKNNGTDYNADIAPVSEAWFFQNSGSNYTQLADAGYTASAAEYLNSADRDFTIPWTFNQPNDFIAFGSTSKFGGLNIQLKTNGVGNSPTIVWEYWNGSSWSTLTTAETEPGVANLTQSGNINWTTPSNWATTTINSGRPLFYVKGRLASGSFSTPPTESRITTDILMLQYLGTISSDNVEIDVREDNTAPTISSVSADSPTSNGATISWHTNENSSSRVNYGLTSNYGSSTPETNTSTRVKDHSVSLSGLISCTTYHYRVRSTDVSTNERVDGDNTFTTSGCVGSASVDSQISSQITIAVGGTLTLHDSNSHGLSLVVPTAFADTDANFQAHQLDKTAVLNTAAEPAGYTTAGSYLYEIKAMTDTATTLSTFDKDNPLTITIAYGISDISGIDESSLKIYRWDGEGWNLLNGCTVDALAKAVSCTTTHFSVFGLFGKGTTTNINTTSQSSGNSTVNSAGCGNLVSSGVPDLFEIRTSKNTATLYFVPPPAPYSSIYIAYSRKPDNWEYGVEYNQQVSAGVLKYTINKLQPNTKIYFKLRTGNGCATGNWSNTMSASTTNNSAQKIFYKNIFTAVKEKIRPTTDNIVPSKNSQTDKIKIPAVKSNAPTPKPVSTIKPSQKPSTQPKQAPTKNDLCFLRWCFSVYEKK